MKNERLEAFKILQAVVHNQKSLTHALKAQPITPLIQALSFGVCRYFFRLQSIINHLVKKPPEADVALVLMMGLFQLLYLDKPEYAVVRETVELTKLIRKTWAGGLINAVLRNFCRKRHALLATLNLDKAFNHNHPAWLIEGLQQDWPYNWQDILKANDTHPPFSVRVNLNKTTKSAYLALLQQHHLPAEAHQYSSTGVRLLVPCAVDKLPGFAEGLVSVQDEAAQRAVPLLNLTADLRILDVGCAPGGKLGHILETMPGAQCIGLDVDKTRLERVTANLTRLNLHTSLICADACDIESWWDKTPFDRILLDAPCSATGVIRRHPDIKLLRTPLDVAKVVALQARLLTNIWQTLRPGGRLVYATCSVLNDENARQIQQFLSHHADARCLPIAEHQSSVYGLQLLPKPDGGDGFFYSVLEKAC